MLKGTMAQQIYRFWTSGAPLSAFARWASVMLLEGPALVSVDSRFYTSFFLALWGWGWKSEILLGPSQWEAAYVSRHWWTTETDENDLLGWNNTVSQVRSFKQPTILCGASLLSDHTSDNILGASSSGGQRPQLASFLAEKHQEIGLMTPQSTHNEQRIQPSHLRKVCTHQMGPVLD